MAIGLCCSVLACADESSAGIFQSIRGGASDDAISAAQHGLSLPDTESRLRAPVPAGSVPVSPVPVRTALVPSRCPLLQGRGPVCQIFTSALHWPASAYASAGPPQHLRLEVVAGFGPPHRYRASPGQKLHHYYGPFHPAPYAIHLPLACALKQLTLFHEYGSGFFPVTAPAPCTIDRSSKANSVQLTEYRALRYFARFNPCMPAESGFACAFTFHRIFPMASFRNPTVGLSDALCHFQIVFPRVGCTSNLLFRWTGLPASRVSK